MDTKNKTLKGYLIHTQTYIYIYIYYHYKMNIINM